jgi:Mg/Co/Ni transporter MgtE
MLKKTIIATAMRILFNKDKLRYLVVNPIRSFAIVRSPAFTNDITSMHSMPLCSSFLISIFSTFPSSSAKILEITLSLLSERLGDAKVLSLLDPDEAVDIILTLDKHARSRILALFEPEKHEQIAQLIALSHTPIGDIISIEFTSVNADQTVRQVKAVLSHELESQVESSNVYVTNKSNQLVGVFNLHELLAHSEDTQVYKFMVQNLVVVYLSTPKEIAWKKMIKYKFGYLPVVDGEKKMIGIVRWFDIADDKSTN